jgi:hypothetical protein
MPSIDEVPIIAVRALEGRVLVIDLARFGELGRGTLGSTHPAEPELTLLQPDDPSTRPAKALRRRPPMPAGTS